MKGFKNRNLFHTKDGIIMLRLKSKRVYRRFLKRYANHKLVEDNAR